MSFYTDDSPGIKIAPVSIGTLPGTHVPAGTLLLRQAGLCKAKLTP
mgnify:CR=1 FL=1